jgi:hypothetical protein
MASFFPRNSLIRPFMIRFHYGVPPLRTQIPLSGPPRTGPIMTSLPASVDSLHRSRIFAGVIRVPPRMRGFPTISLGNDARIIERLVLRTRISHILDVARSPMGSAVPFCEINGNLANMCR